KGTNTEAQMGCTLEALAKVGAMVAGFSRSGRARSMGPVRKPSWLVRHKLEGVRNAGWPFVKKQLTSSMLGKDLEFVAHELLPIKLALWKILYAKRGFFSIVELWNKSVRRNPDNVFLKGDGYRYSYGEFDRVVNDIACRLRELGLGPKHKVAV